MQTSPIRKLARIVGRPQQADALRQALLQLEAATRQEEGCREFGFFQSISDPEAFVLIEAFDDQASLDGHLAQPHTRAFFRRQLVAAIEVTPLAA